MKKPKRWCLLGNRGCRDALQQQEEAAKEEGMHDDCRPILLFFVRLPSNGYNLTLMLAFN